MKASIRPWPPSAAGGSPAGGSAVWVPTISSMYFTVILLVRRFLKLPAVRTTGMTNGEVADRQAAGEFLQRNVAVLAAGARCLRDGSDDRLPGLARVEDLVHD